MAQDMLNKKKEFINQAVAYATKAAALTRDIKELSDYWTDNGFALLAANPIVQADIDASGQTHLTPAVLAAFVAAIGNVALNGQQRTVMRQVAGSAIPSQ